MYPNYNPKQKTMKLAERLETEKLRIKDNPKLLALQAAMISEVCEVAMFISLEERWDRYIRFGLEGGSMLIDHGFGGYVPIDRFQGRDREYINRGIELGLLKKEYRHYGSMSSGRYAHVVSTTQKWYEAIESIRSRLNNKG
jgi:hypothetical protein